MSDDGVIAVALIEDNRLVREGIAALLKDASLDDLVATIRSVARGITVKSHVRNIVERLTLHTRPQIAAYAHGQQNR